MITRVFSKKCGFLFSRGLSFLHCLPCSMVDPNGRAVGAAMRVPQLEAFAREAGFSKFEIVGDTPFKFRIFKLMA